MNASNTSTSDIFTPSWLADFQRVVDSQLADGRKGLCKAQADFWVRNSEITSLLLKEVLCNPKKHLSCAKFTIHPKPRTLLCKIRDGTVRVTREKTNLRINSTKRRFGLTSYRDFSSNYRDWFRTKLETGVVSKVRYSCGDLKQPAVDSLIISAIGGRKAVLLKLGVLFSLLEADGEILRIDESNLFFVTDYFGKLRTVSVKKVGLNMLWKLSANSVDSQDEWPAGTRVFYPTPKREVEKG